MVTLCRTAQNKGKSWPDSHDIAIQEVADSWVHPKWPSVIVDLRYVKDRPEGPPEKYSRPYRLQQVAWHNQSKAEANLIRDISGVCRHLPEGFTISPKKKGATPKLQQTFVIVMREEIVKMLYHNLISDSLFIVQHIQCCLEDMMQEMGISATDFPTGWVTPVPIRLWFTAPELGHALIDDNNDRLCIH